MAAGGRLWHNPVAARTFTRVLAQAFGVSKYGRAHKVVQRNLDRSHRKEHVPISDRELDVEPPVVVVVMGPAGVGKTTLIKVPRLSLSCLTFV